MKEENDFPSSDQYCLTKTIAISPSTTSHGREEEEEDTSKHF